MKAQPSHGKPSSRLPGVMWLKLKDIDTQAQVRKSMDKAALQELADDIKAHGLLSPILVRPNGSRYTVIAGHRRRFACEIAGLDQVPAIVGEADADQVLEMQMAENLQREDLTTEEVADIVNKLYEKHASMDTVALILNKSKSWVSKHIKLATQLHYTARKLFEEGVTEDLELLLMHSDIAWISSEEAAQVEKLIREDSVKPFQAPIRGIVRDRLAALKASQAAQRQAASSPSSRKASKPKARNADQLAAEFLYGSKKPSEILEKWTGQEQTTFRAAYMAAFRAGQQIKREPLAVLAASHSNRRDVYALAMWTGFLNPSQEAQIDEDAFLDLLDAWWGEMDAK